MEDNKTTKTQQIYFIYVYDTVKGWVKCSRHVNPPNGFEYEEDASRGIILLSNNYPKREYTIMSVYITKD